MLYIILLLISIYVGWFLFKLLIRSTIDTLKGIFKVMAAIIGLRWLFGRRK